MILDQEGFFQRVCEVLGAKNAPEIAEMLEISKQSVYLWQKGGWPHLDTLEVIASKSNASLHWLLTGKGERNVSAVPHSWQKNLALSAESEDTAPVQLPTAEHTLQPVPLIGTIIADRQQIVRPQEKPHVMVPAILVREDTVLFRIEGNELAAEGLRDGDLVLVREAVEPFDNKAVLALIDGERVIIRRYFKFGTMVHFSPIEGDSPIIRFPAETVEVKYLVTSVTRAFE